MIDIEFNHDTGVADTSVVDTCAADTSVVDTLVDFYEELYHDLKTPMALVFGYIQSLEQLRLSGEAAGFLAGIKNNSFRMAKLLRDANDRTNLDRGLMRPAYKNIDAVRFFGDICENARNLMYRKKISLEFSSNAARFPMAMDEDAWVRILLNLLTNAKDYSGTGGKILCKLQAARHEIVLSVEDHGPGVPVELKDRVFDRYTRAPFSEHSGARGTHSGIGLYIAKKLVELMGGEISLQDALPGTRAVVRAPVFFAEETPEFTVDDFFSDNAVQLELAGII